MRDVQIGLLCWLGFGLLGLFTHKVSICGILLKQPLLRFIGAAGFAPLIGGVFYILGRLGDILIAPIRAMM